jgi:hypothetical protein
VSLAAAPVDPTVSVPEFGPTSPGRPPRFGRPALTLGIAPDCPPLDCDPDAVLDALASPREPDGMPAVELDEELDAALDEELEDALEDALEEREDGIGGCDDARDDEAEGIDGDDDDCDDDGIEGDDGILDELLDELGLLGDGIEAEDDELWLCD